MSANRPWRCITPAGPWRPSRSGHFGDWQVAAAYEGMARASAAAGDVAGRDYWVQRCTVALGAVPDAGDRSVVAEQLLNLPEPPAQEE